MKNVLLMLFLGCSLHVFAQLGAPTLSSPADKSLFYVGSTITFSWSTVAGATSYDVEFDAGTGYVYVANVTGTSLSMLQTASNAGQHSWHVRAKSGTTAGLWSSNRSYQVVGIPSIPTTYNPFNEATVNYGANVNFNWSGVNTASGYQIQFDNDAPVTVSGTNYTRSFNTLGSHTWKVLASNQAGNSDWSLPKTLTVVLGTPNLSSPANGSTFYVGASISFSWTAVAGAASYDVEFDAGMGYTSLTNVTGTSLNLTLSATNAGPHTWHVRAVNGATIGSWSNSLQYTVIGVPPIPVTTSPVSGSTVFYETLTTFTWNKTNNASGYLIQFDAETPITVSGGTSYARAFTSLGDHTWKVKATNDAGSSDWSDIKVFTVTLAPPSLTAPAGGNTSYVGSNLTFSWAPVLGATSYDVEFDAGLGTTSLTNVTTTSLQWTLTNAQTGSHTWHVRAKNNTSTGPWSSTRNFTVAGLPGIPVTTNPPAEAIIFYDTPVTFSWNSVLFATSYLLQFDAETPVTLTGTSYTRSFSVTGSHSWKVKAVNGLGESDWSAAKNVNVTLGTPSLTSPANNAAYFVGDTISFTWTAVLGAASYDVEFDAGMGYVSLSNVTPNSLNQIQGTTNAGPHTWHVRARNGSTVGQWSSTRSYNVTGKPAIPTLNFPTNGATFGAETNINFSWSSVNSATGYKIQFDSETPVVVSGTFYSRSFSTPGTHTWKVLASNDAGDSGWSTARTINIGLTTPSLTAPANGATFYVGNTINFTWTSVQDATSYDIEFDAGTGYVSLTNVTGTSLNLQLTASSAGPHNWHVRARYGTTAGQWSSSRSYSVAGIPSIPTLVSPADGSTVFSEILVNFTWSRVPNASGYQIQFDADAPIPVTGTSYSSIFTTLGSHTWKVKAINAAGESDWSQAFNFTVGLGVPNLVLPANGAVFFVGSTISFSWTPMPGATSYDVEIDAGTQQVALTNITGTSMDLPVSAASVGQHTWHVRAKYGVIEASWSSTRAFLVISVPAVPTPTAPVNGAIVYSETATDFTWKGVFGATSYQVQIDNEAAVTVNATTYSRTVATQGNHTWKVKAVNAAGESDWSAPATFIVSLGSPTLPTKILMVSPDNGWDFGNVTVNNANEKSFELQNAGNSTLNISGLSLSGTNADQFLITAPAGTSFDIPAGGIQLVTIRFKPGTAGLMNAYLAIGNNSGNASPSKLITLTGTGSLLQTKTLAVEPDGVWDFGTVTVNSGSEKIFTLKNNGTTSLQVSGLSLSGTNADQFVITAPAGSTFDIPAGGLQQVTIRFKPSSAGSKSAIFTVANNSDNASPTHQITLRGTGSLQLVKTLSVTPDEFVDFGSVTVNNTGDKTFTLQNTGTTALSVTGLTLTGTNAGQFSITNPASSTFDIPAGGIQQVTIRFKPTAEGWESAYFTIVNNADNASPSKVIILNGNGSLAPTKTLNVVPNDLWNYGTALLNTDNDKIFTLQNSGSVALSVTGLTLTGTNAGQFVITTPANGNFDIPAGGTQQVNIRFKPTAEGWMNAALSIANNADNASPFKLITLNGTGASQLAPVTASVNTITVTAVTASTATASGEVTADGGAPVTARGVCWSTALNPTLSDSKTLEGSGIGSFTGNLTGLTAGTTYHVRAYATNSAGTSYGADVQFTTLGMATVTTSAATANSSTSASAGGNVTADGGATVTARGVCWSVNANPTTADAKTSDGTGTGTFTSNLTGLTAGTTYHVRAYATNAVGTSYGADVQVTTMTLPTVTTAPAAASSSTTGTGGGNVTADGGAPVSVKGICWSISANPTIASAKTSDGKGTGTFTSILAGLTAGTTYHVRAYATNSVGTSYGADVQFTTFAAPTVVTVSAIATVNPSTSATGKGNVTFDGGAAVSEKGLCWSTSANPTTADSKTSDGSGIGTFTDILTGLTPGTTYHLRAFATNSVGTAYGEDLTFKTTVNGGVYSISSFFHIYPNPTHGRITVLTAQEVPVDLNIYSLRGILMYNVKLTGQETVLDLNLPKGVYLVKLKSEKVTGTYQLIIY